MYKTEEAWCGQSRCPSVFCIDRWTLVSDKNVKEVGRGFEICMRRPFVAHRLATRWQNWQQLGKFAPFILSYFKCPKNVLYKSDVLQALHRSPPTVQKTPNCFPARQCSHHQQCIKTAITADCSWTINNKGGQVCLVQSVGTLSCQWWRFCFAGWQLTPDDTTRWWLAAKTWYHGSSLLLRNCKSSKWFYLHGHKGKNLSQSVNIVTCVIQKYHFYVAMAFKLIAFANSSVQS